jgi:hypothetical protein
MKFISWGLFRYPGFVKELRMKNKKVKPNKIPSTMNQGWQSSLKSTSVYDK